MTEEGDLLRRLLDLEKIEENIFRSSGDHVHAHGRVFGGQVAAQSLVAAGRTVERGGVHSLHSYFLRPGDPAVPILFEVDRIRDGRSFTTRRVVAVQHGEAIFNLHCSFQVTEHGLEHQDEMPAVPGPDGLPVSFARGFPRPGSVTVGAWGVEVRFVEVADEPESGPTRARRQVWLRPLDSLPDDPLVHAAVIAYESDLTILSAVLLPHAGRLGPDRGFTASLDHCMWFHRPIRADEWLLYDQHSPAASGARGLALGALFTAEGVLGVSVAQEGLIRLAEGTGP